MYKRSITFPQTPSPHPNITPLPWQTQSLRLHQAVVLTVVTRWTVLTAVVLVGLHGTVIVRAGRTGVLVCPLRTLRTVVTSRAGIVSQIAHCGWTVIAEVT